MLNRKSWLAIVFFSFAIISFSVIFYIFWFFLFLHRDISDNPEQWGQFGDYLGGVLNPILSFISICILVKTAFYQDDISKKQEEREERKRFEDRFYGMVSYQRQSFSSFSLVFPSGASLTKGDAVRCVEDALFNHGDFNILNSNEIKNSVFSLVRQFYLILKNIDDEAAKSEFLNESDKSFYYRSLINLTDFDLMRIVVFGAFFYDSWANSKYIYTNEGFLHELELVGLKKYIELIKKMKEDN